MLNKVTVAVVAAPSLLLLATATDDASAAGAGAANDYASRAVAVANPAKTALAASSIALRLQPATSTIPVIGIMVSTLLVCRLL